jgi:hypothetical protein
VRVSCKARRPQPQPRWRFAAGAAGTAPCGVTLTNMSVFFFIAGVTAVAGGSLAALYYLLGPPSQDEHDKSKRRPGKKHLLSHWR